MNNDQNQSKFINEQDFFNNFKIFYSGKTTKLHIAIYNTNGTNFDKEKKEIHYKNNASDGFNKRYEDEFNQIGKNLQNAFETKYQKHNGKFGAKKVKEVKRYIEGVSSLAAFFGLIEELIFNTNYQNIELSLGNAATGLDMVVSAESKLNKFGNWIKSKKVKIGNTKRFSEVFTIVVEAAIQKQNAMSGKPAQAKFDNESTTELMKKILGDNYPNLLKALPIGTIVTNAIAGNSKLIGTDFQYEIQFDTNSPDFQELQAFLNENPSDKNLNGFRTVDSKLFMEKFFGQFLKENLIREEEIVVSNNQNSQIENSQNSTQSKENPNVIQTFENTTPQTETITSATSSVYEDAEEEEIIFEQQHLKSQSTSTSIDSSSTSSSSSSTVVNNNITSNQDSHQAEQITDNKKNQIQEQPASQNSIPSITLITPKNNNSTSATSEKNTQNTKQNTEPDVDANKNKQNNKQEKQSCLGDKIKNLLRYLKNILKKSEFKTDLHKMQKITKKLTAIIKKINSLDKGSNEYKKCINEHNELLKTYGESLAKAKDLIQKSRENQNEKQACSRELRLQKYKEVQFQRIEIAA
jgi:hypothetical protein